VEKDKKCDEPPQFVKIVRNVAKEHKYSDEYNCDEFAKEAVRRLKDAGYNAYYCTGEALWINNSNRFHAWGRISDDIYFEAVTGEFLTPQKYRSLYNEFGCV